MGCFYFNQSAPAVSVTLTPVRPPIQIPSSGGSFSFNISIQNGSSSQQILDFWIMQILPNTTWQGPMLGPVNLTLSPGFVIQRTRSQNVPRSAMPGVYTYIGYVGNYSTSVKWDSSFFNYTKLAAGDWSNTGESLGSTSDEFIISARPNPFNESVTIKFVANSTERANVSIFNLRGQKVVEMFDGLAEANKVNRLTFNAAHLSSGIYFCQLHSASRLKIQKLIYLK